MGEAEPDRKSLVTVEMDQEGPSLIRWTTLLARYSPFESYAARTEAGWVLIDPEILTDQEDKGLEEVLEADPVAIILTSDGHERCSHDFAERWSIEVWGPETIPVARKVAYERDPHHRYAVGDALPGGVTPIKLRGAWGGDHALLWETSEGKRILFTGDILNGQVEQRLSSPEHYRWNHGLYFGARPQYIDRHDDREGLKQSLYQLLDIEIDVICGAHGTPYSDNPRDTVADLIKTL